MKYPSASLSIGLTFGLTIGLLASVVGIPAGPALSSEPTKTLKLAFGHTGETGTFTFKRNGVYDQGELKRLNHFLRDWRKDQSTRIDPHLLDLVWSIYQKTGSHDAIHVVSAYRSPATNEMLRSRAGSGVAKHSQHRLGKAMDWYLTDVPLPKLRAVAMQMQGGGVGYYPRSGSPFVHTDTGNVRAWPRMSRQQLIALFPNGNTLHLPADGKPLPGYEQAVARRHTASGGTALAYLDTGAGSEADETDRTGTDASSSWLKRVFPGKQQSEDVAAMTPAAATAPTTMPASDAPQTVAAADEDINADMPRQPRARPDNSAGGETVLASLDASVEDVSTPLPKSRPNQGEDTAAPAVDDEDAIASLADRMNQDYPDSTIDAADPIALAFAAASDAPQPAEADRAILAAFATLADSDAIRPPDPDLTAALTRIAGEENAQQQQPEQPTIIAASYDGSDLLLRTGEPEPQVTGAIVETAAPVAESEPVVVAPEPQVAVVAEPENIVQSEPAIVLASAEAPSYGGDEHILVNLIETPAETPASNAGELAMPKPASGLLVAPEGASEVADLRGQSGPPVARFTRSGGTQPEEGFLSRLFASLVE